jgi:ATP phosphoribosyltransferase regulatory subunit
MTEDTLHPALLPAGLSDLLPPEAEREAMLIERILALFAAHGYERVKPPLLEFEESLLAGSGAAVAEQTFRLMDPVSQRMMGLRADITPQVARIAATRLRNLPRPLRLSYSGQVLRVRGSQLAPGRQLPQAGIEIIGSDSVAADAEVALLGVQALVAVGVPRVRLDLLLPTLASSLLDAAGVTGARRAALSHALDRKDAAAVEAACAAHPALAALPALLAAAGPAEAAVEVLERLALPPAARAIADRGLAVFAAIRAAAPDLPITLDPVEFRGLRYHTGVAFTLYGAGREVARGGRYLSGEEPATGCTLYPDAMLAVAPPLPPPRRIFVPLGADPARAARARARGFVTVAALSPADTPHSLRCEASLSDLDLPEDD